MKTKSRALEIAQVAGLAALYFVAGRLGLALGSSYQIASPVWPPTGLSLAAMLLLGYRLWPGVALGAFLVNATVLAKNHAWLGGAAASLGIAAGNTLEALVGAWLVNRYANGPEAFRRPRTILLFVALAGVLSTIISANTGLAVSLLAGLAQWPNAVHYWFTWWLGDVASAIVITPVVIAWSTRWLVPQRMRLAEAAALLILLFVLCETAFGEWFATPARATPLVFVVLPILLWTALRFGLRGTATVSFIIACLATAATLDWHGPFALGSRVTSLLLLQNFVVVITVMSLILSADVAQRRQSEAGLRASEQRYRELFDQIRQLNAQLERRVGERTAQLEAINKELEAFSYSVSHDLRAPLRSIRGFGEVLLQRYAVQLDARGQEFLRRTCEASQHMDRLIEDVLQLSRVGRGAMRRQNVNLTELAASVAEELCRAEPKRKVQFVIAPGLQVHGDERLLRVALENLLRNAWKFTARQPKARIEIGCASAAAGARSSGLPMGGPLDAPPGSAIPGFASRNTSVEVSVTSSKEPAAGPTSTAVPNFFVRDNGVGFDMAHAGELFGVFHRLHSAAEFPGTGIGLANVQRIISRHGGQVWAEAAVNQGATFYFTLPEHADA